MYKFYIFFYILKEIIIKDHDKLLVLHKQTKGFKSSVKSLTEKNSVINIYTLLVTKCASIKAGQTLDLS